MRTVTALVALLLAITAALPAAGLAADPEPKVVLIVGPSGEATDRYLDQAETAAQVAEQYTSNVVRVYSPEATWPAVTQALEDAAVVVYMGHGNGWPSKYRDSLFGGTQNGFGLNPVAGGPSDAHQYFGEDWIAAEVDLADNAVVLLHHLCYASGNTEPGLPEGTVDDARQRVDNYAAGFIRAGAGAVVAEGHLGPAWYVEQLLAGEGSIDEIWRRSPNARGNESTFASARSAGFLAAMDPDSIEGGYYRSIVYREAAPVEAGELPAAPPAPPVPVEPPDPTLVGTGMSIEMPYFRSRPLAGTEMELWIPYTIEDPAALEGMTVGTRWDPIDVRGTPANPESAGDAAAGEGGTTEAAPAASEPPVDPSEGRVSFIEPEQRGSVVEPVAAVLGDTRIRVPVSTPAQPGRYRLVATLHDPSGVAFDAATQALMPSLFVDVMGELEARYLVAPAATVPAGERFDFRVAVANVGSKAWGQPGDVDVRNMEERPIAGSLVAHWVRLDAIASALPADVRHALPAGFEPGATERATLALTAPAEPGSYLLLFDVVITGIGSLTGLGAEPALVRVTVE